MKVLLAIFEDNDAAVIKLFRNPEEDPVPYMERYLTTWMSHRKLPVAFKTYEFHEGWASEPNWVSADPNPLMVLVYPVARKGPGVVDVLAGGSSAT